MASTIKLKTSTSSGNVPASLSKGELAINVTDGVWYYGGASAVQQNFTFGSVTVTGDTSLDGKLVVTGNTVMNGSLSATTRVQVGNGDGIISGHTISSINSTVGDVLNITGGDGAITFGGASSIKIPDDTSSALVIEEANNAYLSFFTTNASPVIQLHQPQVNVNTLTVGTNGTGYDVKFFGDTAGAYMLWDQSADDLIIAGDGGLSVDGVTNLDNTDIDGTFTMDGTAFDVNGTTTVAIDNTNTTNGVTINTVTSGSKVFIGHTTSETTVNDNLSVTGDLAVDGTANLDNTDIDGTLVVDGSNISLDSTSTLNIDNSNTSNGITIGTATSGVPIQLGHSTSNVRINDNLVVTGNTVMNGTLSATTSLKVGNGNGTISAATINGVAIGSDASPVTAYINSGEIDGVTLGGEVAVSGAGFKYIDIANSEADNVALSVIGHASQTATILEVKDGGEEGTIHFGVAANGRCSIPSAVIEAGTINNTSIGATTKNTGAFTTLTSQLALTSQSHLIVTGNTTLNGTLSATTSAKVGNGDGLISGATLHAGNVLKSDGTLVVTGNTVLNGTLSATTSAKIGNGDGLVSAATVTAAGSVTLPDNGKLKLGNAGDLEIYHDSNNSYIDDTGTGSILYRSGTQTFQNAAGSKTMAIFNAASTVDLSFDNNVKLSTNTSGVHITGTLSANTAVYAGTGVDDGVISANTVNGAYQFITFVGNSGALTGDGWQYPGTNGISNHTWGYNATGYDGISTGSTTIPISRTKQMSYIVLPAGTRIVGIEGAIRSSTDDTGYAGLFTCSPDYGGPDTVNATLRILAQTVDASGGASVLNDPQYFKSYAAFASQYVVQEGDQIIPAFRRNSSSSQTIVGTFTIIVKY